MGEVVRFLEQLPSNWEEIRQQIAGMEDIREIVAAERRVKALGEVIAAERETNEDAFGLAICALDLMARAGEGTRIAVGRYSEMETGIQPPGEWPVFVCPETCWGIDAEGTCPRSG